MYVVRTCVYTLHLCACCMLMLLCSVFVVLDAVAPDDHHVMQNGVMYAVVNKKRKPTSTDGKTDMLIPTDEKRGTPTSTEGIRDTPTSTEGIRDTPTSTNRGMCSSKPSGYNGYEEIDVDFTLAKKKGGHHVTSSAGLVLMSGCNDKGGSEGTMVSLYVCTYVC